MSEICVLFYNSVTLEFKEMILKRGWQEWWRTLAIPALGRRRQNGQELKASLGYKRPYLKKKKKGNKKRKSGEGRRGGKGMKSKLGVEDVCLLAFFICD